VTMRALFDVNALLAVFDRDHIDHSRIRAWWSANKKGGWATWRLSDCRGIRCGPISNSGRMTSRCSMLSTSIVATFAVPNRTPMSTCLRLPSATAAA
jgi:hypothetical protein